MTGTGKEGVQLDELQSFMDASPFINSSQLTLIEADVDGETLAMRMSLLLPEFERAEGSGQFHGDTIATLIDELRFFERAGLTRLQVLKTSSQNAAAFLGDGDTRGSIQAGMTADLVLLGANPLDDLNHLWRVEGVMADGRWATRGDLLTQLKTIVYSENNAVTN